jgi:hypothetical protein
MPLFSLINILANILIIFFIPIFIFEFYSRDPTTQFNPIISYSIIIIVFLIWYFSPDEGNNNNNTNNYNNKNDKIKDKKNSSYCLQMDMNSYEKIGELNTNIQVSRLQKTKEFQKMYEEKGDNLDNWNWQSRERLQNKKQLNESDIGSDDIENLTLSD